MLHTGYLEASRLHAVIWHGYACKPFTHSDAAQKQATRGDSKHTAVTVRASSIEYYLAVHSAVANILPLADEKRGVLPQA